MLSLHQFTQCATPSLPFQEGTGGQYWRVLESTGDQSRMFVGGEDKQVLENHAGNWQLPGYRAIHCTTLLETPVHGRPIRSTVLRAVRLEVHRNPVNWQCWG